MYVSCALTIAGAAWFWRTQRHPAGAPDAPAGTVAAGDSSRAQRQAGTPG